MGAKTIAIMENSKKKILIVDDEPDIVIMIQMRLEAGGYAVISASDGNNGYAKAKSENLDLIILDVMLPGWMAIRSAVCLSLTRNTSTSL